MYLHLGSDTVVSSNDIIGIFDLEATTVSKATRDFLAAAEKNGEVFNVSYELPKSFIACNKSEGGTVIYISQISCHTLLKRLNFVK